MGRKSKFSAFTLIELLIVLVIIGVLATVAIPAYQAMTEKAKWAEAASTLGAIRRACLVYYNENGEYPNAQGAEVLLNGTNKSKNSWDGSGDYSNIVNALGINVPDIKADGRFGYALYMKENIGPGDYYPCAFAFLDNNTHNGLHDGTQEQYLTITYDGKFYNLNQAPKYPN